ncbi:hypothetical protein MKX03_024600, partial [Papaver bracteatum]
MDDSTAPRTLENDSRNSRRKSKRKKSKKVETPKKRASKGSLDDESPDVITRKGRKPSKKAPNHRK